MVSLVLILAVPDSGFKPSIDIHYIQRMTCFIEFVLNQLESH